MQYVRIITHIKNNILLTIFLLRYIYLYKK